MLVPFPSFQISLRKTVQISAPMITSGLHSIRMARSICLSFPTRPSPLSFRLNRFDYDETRGAEPIISMGGQNV